MIQTSATLHIRTFASYAADEKKLFTYLINKQDQEKLINLQIPNQEVKRVVQVMELVGDGPDLNPIWRECRKKLEEDPLVVKIAGTSITIIQYELK